MELGEWLSQREVLQSVIQQQLLRASQRMKQHADLKRSERVFDIGDLVYVKLQPYVQTFLAPRSNQKLAYKYFGPFKVLERVGRVAYKLELPPEARIHPTIHVSQLKKHVPSPTVVLLHCRQCPLMMIRPFNQFTYWTLGYYAKVHPL